jgi:hypothetical protein
MITQSKRVADLAIGDEFLHHDRRFRVLHTGSAGVETLDVQFNSTRTYYDPQTAQESGDLDWNCEVQPVA